MHFENVRKERGKATGKLVDVEGSAPLGLTDAPAVKPIPSVKGESGKAAAAAKADDEEDILAQFDDADDDVDESSSSSSRFVLRCLACLFPCRQW